MIAFMDTNVVVGLLLGATDVVRFAESQTAVERALSEGCELTVTECVFCESFWVLESRYAFARLLIASRMSRILETEAISAWDQPLAFGALALLVDESRLDVADCLLAAQSALVDGAVLTFDRRLSSVLREVEIVEL